MNFLVNKSLAILNIQLKKCVVLEGEESDTESRKSEY